MMSPEKAAQYLIVGWVKDWTFKTYLSAVYGANIPWREVANDYKFLPENSPHVVRVYIASIDRKLSDALWDAKDDKARLALAARVLNIDGSKYRWKRDSAQSACAYANKRLTAAKLAAHVIDGLYKRGSRGAWNVCK